MELDATAGTPLALCVTGSCFPQDASGAGAGRDGDSVLYPADGTQACNDFFLPTSGFSVSV